jgi:acetolactate synthase-1/3 small subunit
MQKEHYISIWTENHIGLLNRITIIFTRRHLNIESLTVSSSEIKGIHRFSIVVQATEELVVKVVKQIEKLVEVIRASYYTRDEVILQEIALYKIATSALVDGNRVENLIRESNARILRIEPNYVIIEKTGTKEETQDLFEKLNPYHVLQFVRSGTVVITKELKEFTNYLREIDRMNQHIPIQLSIN